VLAAAGSLLLGSLHGLGAPGELLGDLAIYINTN
jgi:hypothetical protein